MSDLFTRIRLAHLPGVHGFMDRGRRTRVEMIARLREMARQQLREAQAIIEADDADFVVDIVRGALVQRRIEELPARPAGVGKS